MFRVMGVAVKTPNETGLLMKQFIGGKNYAIARHRPSPTPSATFQPCMQRQIVCLGSSQAGVNHENTSKIEAPWAGVRLSNENGYLSWMRNGYISTICGATMNVQELVVAHSEKAAAVMLCIAFGNMTLGTVSFLNYLNWFYRDCKMSRTVYLLQSAIVIVHLLLWYAAILLYFMTFDFITTKKRLTDPEIVKMVMQKKN